MNALKCYSDLRRMRALPCAFARFSHAPGVDRSLQGALDSIQKKFAKPPPTTVDP